MEVNCQTLHKTVTRQKQRANLVEPGGGGDGGDADVKK